MSTNIQVHFLENDADLVAVLDYIKQYEGTEVSIDLETNNSLPQKADTFGIGFSFDGVEAFYIPTRDRFANLNPNISSEVLNKLLKTLATKYKVIGHNFVYDYIVLDKDYKQDFLKNLHADTILLKHTIDEERPHGLKETAVKYLGPWADKAQTKLYESIKANGGTTTQDNLEMWKADTAILGEYCGWDCCLTIKLYKLFSSMLEEQGLTKLFYEDEVMPLYKEVTIPMTKNGFPINIEHFKALQGAIRKQIYGLEELIQIEIQPLVDSFCVELLNKDYPVKKTGNFPKVLAELMGVSLPMGKTGKVSLSKATLEKVLDPTHPYTQWLLHDKTDSVIESRLLETQTELFFRDNPERNYIFNLKSNDHLGKLLFDILNLEVIETTDSGKPKVDEDVLEKYKNEQSWIYTLLDMKKLMKLESTYITGILERQYNGVLYPSWLQFGTTSGRYSSKNINCQNLPRIKEEDSGISELVLKYANEIKAGFIANKGYKLIGADYSQLEPCAFACASEDVTLQEVFQKGHDLYSSIAIKTFGLHEYSADKKAENYLGKHRKEDRQKAKVIALAVVYGAGAGRLASILGVTNKEAQVIIDAYLNAYPRLREYMTTCDTQAVERGYVISRFGRIRHIPRAKTLYKNFGPIIMDSMACRKKGLNDVHWELKGLLNLAKNHPIQSTAAYIVNKAAIAFSQRMRELNLSGRIIAQVHDELTCVAREDEADQVSKVLQECMENTTKIEVPLRATPVIADTWAEAK